MIMIVICQWLLDSKYYILLNLNPPIRIWRISRISLWGPPFSGLRSGFARLCSTPTRRAFLRLCLNGGWRWPPTWMREVNGGVGVNGKCGSSKTLTGFTPVCPLFRPRPYLNAALKPLFITDDQRSPSVINDTNLNGWTSVLGIWTAQDSYPVEVNPTFRSSSLSSLNDWSTYPITTSDWLGRLMTLGFTVSSSTDTVSWVVERTAAPGIR